jgi:hypothetical protein
MGYGVSIDYSGMGMMNGVYTPDQQLTSLPSSTFETLPNFAPFPIDGFEQPPPQFPPSQQTINIEQVLFEFNDARRMLFRFDAYGVVSSVTYNVSRLPVILGHSI